MAGPNVVVSVLSDSSKFRRDMDQLGGIGDRVSGALGKIAKIGGAAILAATVAVGGFLATSIKAAGEAEKIAAQTSAVLASTEGVAGKTADAVSRLAGSLSRVSGIDDELIQKGANVLLTFTNIRGVNFDKATQSALDMSVALGQDLQSASTLVGKALNDPIAGLSALTRVGVGFTEQQKAQITAMQQAGDIAGAQGVILAELNRQFGGSAAAFGNTWEGAIGRFQTAFGNIQETVGGAFLPVLTTALNKVSDLLYTVAESPAFTAIVDGIATFVSGLFEGGEAASTFGEIFRVVATILNPFGLVLQALLPVLPSLQGAFLGLAQALGGALLAILPTLSTLLDSVVGALSGVLAAVLPVVIGLVTQLANIFAELAPTLTPVITLLAGILAEALTRLAPIIALVAETIGGILSTALTALAPLLTLAAEFIGQVLEAASPLIDVVLSLLEAFAPLIGVLGELIAAILPPVAELLIALLEPILALVSPLLDLLVPAIQFLAGVLGAIVGVVAGVISAFVGLITGSQDAQAQVMGVWNNVLAFFRGIPKAIGDFFAGAGTWLINSGRALIQGFLDGISAMVGKIGDVVGGVMDFVSGFFPKSPAKRGPFSGSGWASLRKSGLAIAEQFNLGISAGQDLLDVSLGANLRATTGAGFSAPSSAGAGPSAGGGLHIHLDGRVYLTQSEVGRAIREALDEFDRLNGGRG